MELRPRHDHTMTGGEMIMGAGVPSLFHMQQVFWAFVGTALGVAVLVNAFNLMLYRQRMGLSKTTPNPSMPNSFIFQAQATITAVIREFSCYSAPLYFRKWNFYLPPMGPITMMVGYVVLIVVCCLYRLNPKDFLEWEDIGYRCGFIAVCQLPLIVLLSGKRNIVGYLTGIGYERLSWLHRWVARALLMTVLIHMGFWMTEWAKFDYIGVKVKTDVLTQRGIAAGSILAWLVVSSLGPIRALSYEFFVVQHIISWIGFIVAVYYHVPQENRKWVWMPIGFWLFDRLVRAVYLVYNNLSILHRNSTGVLACRATFEPLDESHTRITIGNPPVSWKAGQHVFLTCHPLAPLSSHPFTIASLPEDGKMEFIVRAKRGATRRFFRYAEKVYPSLPSSTSGKVTGRGVLIDGPYARIRPLRQFDSVLFIAGSTGATFTVPLLRDIVRQWKATGNSANRFSLEPAPGAVTRHIKFVWCLKRQLSTTWFASQLDKVITDVETLRNEGHDIAVDISIYITCDETMTSGRSSITGARSDGLGEITQLSRSNSVDDTKYLSEKLEEVPSRSSSIQRCRCTKVVEDGDITLPCCCATRAHRDSSNSSRSQQKTARFVNSRIQIQSGRPNVSTIIRKTAELALGEMAVVVCGPPGLVQCTRNYVVAISDERAVHKGTGAQGIYVHAEAFGYA
jgi:predicted ferric reductase